jgi:hypothetical protein
MLINKTFRKKVVENVKDPIVKAFWVEEFAIYTDRYTQEATPAIQNKIGQFTSNPLIRNIVGQPKSSFDIRQMMDERKILIMNLSKGRVGEVNATLLGSMLVTKIYLAAMSRADVSTHVMNGLPSFYFYVDEFQSFANQSFADILSEARKYKLNLIIAHQYVERVRDAVFGNVGTTAVFRVGPFDAEVLETIFQPQFTQTDLVNLGFAQIYLTLMIDGVGSPPFSATTLPPFDQPPQSFVEQVIESSRKQFGRARSEVEDAIVKWQAIDQEEPRQKAPARDYRDRRPLRAPAPSPHGEMPYVRQEPAHPKAPRRDPHALGEQIKREHAVAASKALDEAPAPAQSRPARPHHPPRSEAPRPDAPPLDGAKSLREALERVRTRANPQNPPPSSGLKEALGKIAPAASAPAVPESKKPAELPKEELQRMLAVDEDGTA